MAAATLGAPANLSDREREAVEALLFRLADDEYVAAERYTDWQVRAPTLESDLALSNIAQDELGHARLWYDLLEDFGHTESELIYEREPDEWRHTTMAELAFEEGDWADAVVRTYLYDTAEEIRLDGLVDSAYPRIRDRVQKVIGEEDYHRQHAESWLSRLASDADGFDRLQSAVDRLVPYALTIFAPMGDVEDDIDEFGLRTESLASMRETWLDTIVPHLEGLGLHVDEANLPEQYDVHHEDLEMPDEIGRDGEHTPIWDELHEEFTYTYHDLGRSTTAEIMADPDDVE